MNKKFTKILVLALFVAVPFVYNSCGQQHSSNLNGEGQFSSSADTCLPTLANGVDPIWTNLQPKCSTCHFVGSSSAPQGYYFADANFAQALQGFANLIKVDPEKIFKKASDSSHFGGAGPTLGAQLEPLKAGYITSANQYMSCLAQLAQNPPPGGGGGPIANPQLNPTRRTIDKPIPANQTTNLNLNWNLTSEMAAGYSLNGAQFQVTLRAVEVGGIRQYHITNPQAKGTEDSAIFIRNIRVFLNGRLLAINEGGGTWTSLNNLAPSQRLHPLPHGTGIMIIAADTTRVNQLSFGFGEIAVSTTYPDFNPTTFTRLTSTNAAIPATERVFRQNCTSCHGATNPSAGLNLLGNLSLLKITGQVVPFQPEQSLIHQRMALTGAGRMPTSGQLPAEQRRWVRDWILDGAPQ